MKKTVLFQCVIVLSVFVLANIAVAPAQKSRKTPDETLDVRIAFQERMETSKPDIVLIGNSMLDEGISSTRLSDLLGRKVEKFVRGGSASAWWYLVLKNVVIEAEIKPRIVTIFFRDFFLTKPAYRTTGDYKLAIEDMANVKEPLLDRLVFEPDGIERYLGKIPLYHQKDGIRSRIENIIKNVITRYVIKPAKGNADEAIQRTFDDSKLDPKQLNSAQLAAEVIKNEEELLDFNTQKKNSFLPAIVELAEDHNIQMVFVRVKRRRDIKPHNEPENVRNYIKDLEQYFTNNNIMFFDFTRDQNIQLKHYGNGDHLNRKTGRGLFTKLFADCLKPVADDVFIDNSLTRK